MRHHVFVSLSMLMACAGAGNSPASPAAEPLPLDQRAQWFRQDRFGMFIHWGVYSVIGKGEWIQDTGQIPLQEYEQNYPKFNPVQFDADRWVSQAKQAGQRYIVITTKHHDGFCMFDSKLTDYTIMHTPLRRDVCKELSEACRKQGLKLGFYYSIMDWHHPDYTPRRPWEKDRTTEGADFNRYVEYMRGQIRELMTNYGEIAVLWFDGGWERTAPEDLQKFRDIIAMARQLQPEMLVNNRANIAGDFETPGAIHPGHGRRRQGGPARAVGSLPDHDHGPRLVRADRVVGLRSLRDGVQAGGPAGPDAGGCRQQGRQLAAERRPAPEGLIRPEESERLAAVGRWMDRHAEAIYGTQASPFRLLPFFGRATRKGKLLYVHVFDWPQERQLVLPGLKDAPLEAYMLEDPDVRVGFSRQPLGETDAIVLHLPPRPADPVASVVALRFAGEPRVEPLVLRPTAEGRLDLPATLAEIHAQHGQRAKHVSQGGRTFIGNWSNPQDVAVWNFTLPAERSFRVAVEGRPAAQEAAGQRIEVSWADQKLIGKINADGVALDGQLRIPAGSQSITVKLLDAKRTGPPILDLFGLRLTPAE